MAHTDTVIAFRDYKILRRRDWPGTEALGIVIIVHGLAEHSGRYQELTEQLNDAGYGVERFDLPGHGLSSGARVFIHQFSDYLDLLSQSVQQLRSEYPQTPVFVLGHSMGGLIVARYLQGVHPPVDGAVLSCPALGTIKPPPRLQVWVGRFLARHWPRVGVVKLGLDYLCSDPRVVAEYQADPLVHQGMISAGLAAAMFDNMALAQAAADGVNVPLLLLHGEDDELTSPLATQAFYENVKRHGTMPCELILYKNMYHEIFNEPQRAEVYRDMLVWLDQQRGLCPSVD